jgi:hypothetical protein
VAAGLVEAVEDILAQVDAENPAATVAAMDRTGAALVTAASALASTLRVRSARRQRRSKRLATP